MSEETTKTQIAERAARAYRDDARRGKPTGLRPWLIRLADDCRTAELLARATEEEIFSWLDRQHGEDLTVSRQDVKACRRSLLTIIEALSGSPAN